MATRLSATKTLDAAGAEANTRNISTVIAIAATPYSALATDVIIVSDTVTIAGASIVNLPTAVGIEGKKYIVMDGTGGAGTDSISITPNGLEEIDGVNAAQEVDVNWGCIAVISDGAGWLTDAGIAETMLNTTHRGSDGTDHADVGTNTSAIAAIVDDHIRAEIPGNDVTTDESEVSAALSGNVGDQFSPTFVVLTVTHVGGVIAADGTINVGTTTDGAEILSGHVLTGLTTVGTQRHIPVKGNTFDILGNATIYCNIESEDSTATTLTIDCHVLGRQFTPTP